MKKITAILLFFLGLIHISLGQCYPERHTTNWFDGWISCEVTQNPNPIRGESHWIEYNLGNVYELGQTHFWNSNDPDHLDYGINEVAIDYSIDGETWFEYGTYNFSEATGQSTYEGEDGPDFSGMTAQYIIITVLTNHGGECAGFSEARFEVLQIVTEVAEQSNSCYQVKIYPNPFSEQTNVSIYSRCSEPISYKIIDATGKMIFQSEIKNTQKINDIDLNFLDLSRGIYFFVVTQNNTTERYTMIRMDGE